MIDREYVLCPKHRPEHTSCLAKRVQRQLKARGYGCSQYQGVIKTAAPPELVKELAAAKEQAALPIICGSADV